MKKLKCLAIDDEPLALDLVKNFMDKVPYFENMGAFESTFEATPHLKQHNVDLIFLDINMPDISGVSYLKSFKNPPMTIFTTAYDQYALEGYELDVVDYLLKPFSFNRFLKSADKAYALWELKNKSINPEPASSEDKDYIFVKSEHNIIKVQLDDILFIEGYKDYLKIHTTNGKMVLTLKSLKSMEEILPKAKFFRVHKSFIVSLDKLDSFRNGRIKVGKKSIPIGDMYKDSFNEKVVKGHI